MKKRKKHVKKRKSEMAVQQPVPLSEIHPHVAAQPRETVNVDKVGEYVEDLSRGDKFPPMIVFYDGKTYWLADGFHRFYAAKTARIPTFLCDVREGGLREAILFSCGANASHGLRRSNQDKRRAVAKLLDDPEWAKWSDERIASVCAVSADLVLKVRKEHAKFTSVSGGEALTSRKYITKYGGEAVMRIVPRKSDPVEPTTIANALYDIERRIDSMPNAEEAALLFPEEKRYLFPIAKLEEMATWLLDFAGAMKQRMVERANAG